MRKIVYLCASEEDKDNEEDEDNDNFSNTG